MIVKIGPEQLAARELRKLLDRLDTAVRAHGRQIVTVAARVAVMRGRL